MKKFWIVLAAVLGLQSCSDKSGVQESSFNDGIVQTVTKYKINFPATMEALAKSFPLAIGSGLQFKGRKADGKLVFYSITDRGANFPIEQRVGSADFSGVVVFLPQFSPFISVVEVNPGVSAEVVDFLPITKDNQKIGGINKDASAENLVTSNLEPFESSGLGLDSESIAVDKDGNFWIGDEYGPSLNLVDSNGVIIRSYAPGDGLPEVLGHMQRNRGFESIAVAPSGKVYALLESVMDIDGQTKDSAQFIRMLELDPETDQVRMFAYPIFGDSSVVQHKTKVSDLAVIRDGSFLVVERTETKAKQLKHRIYKIDLADASDLTNLNLADGQHLEHGRLPQLLHVKMLKKSLLLTAQDYGWTCDKLEGLTVIDDHAIAITNDNDFGIASVRINDQCDKKDCAIVESVQASEPNKHTHLWIIKLAQSLIGGV